MSSTANVVQHGGTNWQATAGTAALMGAPAVGVIGGDVVQISSGGSMVTIEPGRIVLTSGSGQIILDSSGVTVSGALIKMN
jgi:hypothetical protein